MNKQVRELQQSGKAKKKKESKFEIIEQWVLDQLQTEPKSKQIKYLRKYKKTIIIN